MNHELFFRGLTPFIISVIFFIFIYSVIFKNSIFAETKNYAKDIDISFSFGV